jgi:hypothetical protein
MAGCSGMYFEIRQAATDAVRIGEPVFKTGLSTPAIFV